MSEEKSLGATVVACLLGAYVFIAGLLRGNKNKTDTWLEMLNVVKDGVFWVFMALFTLVILAAIIFLFKITFEKIRGAFVVWEKSESWCQKIETSFDEHNNSVIKMREKCQELERYCDHLIENQNKLNQILQELKKFTGADVKKVEMDAELEIIQGA